MIVWATKIVELSEYIRLQDQMHRLIQANPSSYGDFVMLDKDSTPRGSHAVYIGVPEQFLRLFEGFLKVNPASLPDFLSGSVLSEKLMQNFPDIAAKVRTKY